MKKIGLSIIVLMLSFTAAHAQNHERQVYPAYPEPVVTDQQLEQAIVDDVAMRKAGTRRVYPGREIYGTEFGPIPRHPGDYRDAVDRGQWMGGNTGSRSFSIE